MRVFNHFAVDSLANSYVVGTGHLSETGGDAVVVDPAVFDETMLDIIEDNQYTIRAILLTHCNERHFSGLKTLLRIYESLQLYAPLGRVMELEAQEVEHASTISIGKLSVEVIGLPGHSRDSVAYRINGFLFTGCALTAGESGPVPNPYAKALLIENIRDRILSLPDETVIFPFYGPPTTVGVEKQSLPMELPRDLAESI